MTFETMKDLIDVWYSQFKYSNHNINNYVPRIPEIRLDTEPTFKPTHYTITMRSNGRVIKRGITDQHLLQEENFLDMLNEMWDELNKPRTNGLFDDPPSFSRIKHIDLSPYYIAEHLYINTLIKRVIFSDPYTIALWKDGTKTVVRCADEKFDKEKGLAMCIAKKSLGNKGKYYDVFKKWIKEEEK